MTPIKTVHNSPQLREWLRRDVRTIDHAAKSEFSFPPDIFAKAVAQKSSHHPHMTTEQLEMRATHLLLLEGHSGQAPEQKVRAHFSKRVFWEIIFAVIVIFLLLAIATRGHAQNRTGGIVIQLQNQGSNLGAPIGGGLVTLNASTNVTLSRTGTTSLFTLSATGGSGSGCTPPGTTLNAILTDLTGGACGAATKWTASGTTITGIATAILDMSAAATFKPPQVTAPTVEGTSAFNTTTHLPVWGFNGASTATIPKTLANASHKWFNSYDQTTGTLTATQPAAADIGSIPGSSGQLLYNNAGAIDAEDPVVSPRQDAATAQTITATGALTGITITNVGKVLVTVSGTYAGVAFNFEGSPDGTFSPAFPVTASRVDSVATETVSGTLGANTTRSWFVNVSGHTKFRLNATAYTSGTANVTITPVYFQSPDGANVNVANAPTVTAITNALPAGTNVIGHVIDDSGSTTAVTGNVAVTKADGSDVTLGAKADAKSTATDTTAITEMQVLKEISAMEQAPASRAVTNAGTFATQSAITAASGAIASGAVASGAIASGAYASGSISDGAEVTIGAKADAKSTATDTTAITVMQVLKEISAMAQAPAALPANQSTNVAQINGVTPLMGAGNTGTGSPRVTLSTDQAAVATWGQGATGSAAPTGAVQIGGDASGAAGAPVLTAPLNCDGYAKYDASTNGATELVALVASKVVYVCGYTLTSSSATANTLKLVYGTGTACATGQTAMTPGFVLQAPASTGPIGKVVPVSGWGRGLKTASANALCILTNAAQAAQVEVWYAQF